MKGCFDSSVLKQTIEETVATYLAGDAPSDRRCDFALLHRTHRPGADLEQRDRGVVDRAFAYFRALSLHATPAAPAGGAAHPLAVVARRGRGRAGDLSVALWNTTDSAARAAAGRPNH